MDSERRQMLQKLLDGHLELQRYNNIIVFILGTRVAINQLLLFISFTNLQSGTTTLLQVQRPCPTKQERICVHNYRWHGPEQDQPTPLQ